MEKTDHLNLCFYTSAPQKLVLSTRQITIFLMSISLIVLLLMANIVLQVRECQCQQVKVTIPSAANNQFHGFQIKNRSDWSAAPTKNPASDLNLPVSRVIIAHTASSNCSTSVACSAQVNNIQDYHQNALGWDDISYNFLIGGDGYIYEGRGFNRCGACAKGFNNNSICIAFIGTFNDVAPTDRQLEMAQQLLRRSVEANKLSPDYRLYAHRQFRTTDSPGTQLFHILQTWEHWQEKRDQK